MALLSLAVVVGRIGRKRVAQHVEGIDIDVVKERGVTIVVAVDHFVDVVVVGARRS